MSPVRRHFLGVGNILKNKAMENCKLAYTLQFTQKNISICTGHEVSCPASNLMLTIYYV